MIMRMGSREARNNFSELLGQVRYGGQTIVVERSGKPMVAIIPVSMYEQLIAEREARFQVLDRVRSRLPDLAPEDIERDVVEAIAGVRADAKSRS